MAAPTSFVARPARPAPRGGRRAPVARVPALLPVLILAGVALVVTVLAYARALLMPVALAALLAFLLGPIVATFERRIGRIAGVILVVVLASSVLGGLGWAVGSQAASFGEEIWRYRDNLKQKVADIRGAGRGGVIEKVQSTTEEVVEELEKEENPARPDKPVPVVVQPEPLWRLPRLLEALANVALVLILLIFMLLERHELRDRLIRLIGFARLTTTTRAMDEAGRRISRYLLRQTIINGTFGVGVAVGTLVMGLPYAFFWGCLSSVLRFIPYVGPWVSALLVCAFALAYFQGWMQPLLVVGLFVVLELFTNMVMETYLYSQSAGVSQVALLVAVAFWTWLWGAVGLALATPLTVCLAVLGKYVPELRLLHVLMTDEPVLTPDVGYYQRLLARDPRGGAEVVAQHRKAHPESEVYDTVIAPALNHAQRDRRHDQLTDEDVRSVWQATRQVLDELGPGQTTPPEADKRPAETFPVVPVLGIPARDEADELALLMLRQLLDPARFELTVVSSDLLASEAVALVQARAPTVVCIGALHGGGQARHTRYLVKRLRARFPDLRILVGRWGTGALGERVRDLVLAAGADRVGATLAESRDQIHELGQLRTERLTSELISAATSSTMPVT